MSVTKHVMFDEWRYWRRTRLGITILIIGMVMTFAAVLVNSLNMNQANVERATLQQTAEQRFLSQPDRHPHRMVHYGHYVFRNPALLSTVEPGIDPYTGTSIFLEGHRQNSAMFSQQRQSSGLTRFSSLSPGFLLQTLMPLLIIAMGYGAVSREREAGTLTILVTQGVESLQLLAGKFFALISAASLLLVPALIAVIWATVSGESIAVGIGFMLAYIAYITVWALIVITVSTLSKTSRASFGASIGIWIVLCVLMPRIGSSVAVAVTPTMGKLEADYAVLEELRTLGDGHNAADPAFAKLKANLLAQYEVDSVDELPINFRGAVAQFSEAQLTGVLNKHAEFRMAEELEQAKIARQFGWVSPVVAVRNLAMTIAGTDLQTHHRFLREAEALRFDFVQSLNGVHKDHLDYQTDINRSKGPEASKAARVDADHWSVLSAFHFSTESSAERLKTSVLYWGQLALWLVLMIVVGTSAKRKLSQ